MLAASSGTHLDANEAQVTSLVPDGPTCGLPDHQYCVRSLSPTPFARENGASWSDIHVHRPKLKNVIRGSTPLRITRRVLQSTQPLYSGTDAEAQADALSQTLPQTLWSSPLDYQNFDKLAATPERVNNFERTETAHRYSMDSGRGVKHSPTPFFQTPGDNMHESFGESPVKKYSHQMVESLYSPKLGPDKTFETPVRTVSQVEKKEDEKATVPKRSQRLEFSGDAMRKFNKLSTASSDLSAMTKVTKKKELKNILCDLDNLIRKLNSKVIPEGSLSHREPSPPPNDTLQLQGSRTFNPPQLKERRGTASPSQISIVSPESFITAHVSQTNAPPIHTHEEETTQKKDVKVGNRLREIDFTLKKNEPAAKERDKSADQKRAMIGPSKAYDIQFKVSQPSTPLVVSSPKEGTHGTHLDLGEFGSRGVKSPKSAQHGLEEKKVVVRGRPWGTKEAISDDEGDRQRTPSPKKPRKRSESLSLEVDTLDLRQGRLSPLKSKDQTSGLAESEHRPLPHASFVFEEAKRPQEVDEGEESDVEGGVEEEEESPQAQPRTGKMKEDEAAEWFDKRKQEIAELLRSKSKDIVSAHVGKKPAKEDKSPVGKAAQPKITALSSQKSVKKALKEKGTPLKKLALSKKGELTPEGSRKTALKAEKIGKGKQEAKEEEKGRSTMNDLQRMKMSVMADIGRLDQEIGKMISGGDESIKSTGGKVSKGVGAFKKKVKEIVSPRVGVENVGKSANVRSEAESPMSAYTPSMRRGNLLYQKGKERDQKLAEIRQRKVEAEVERETEGCTFRPHLNKKRGLPEVDKSFEVRNREWAERRDQKLRDAEEKKRMEEETQFERLRFQAQNVEPTSPENFYESQMQWRMGLDEKLTKERLARDLEDRMRPQKSDVSSPEKRTQRSAAELSPIKKQFEHSTSVPALFPQKQERKWPVGSTKEVKETVDLIAEATQALDLQVTDLKERTMQHEIPLTMKQRKKYEEVRREVNLNREHLFTSLKPCEVVRHMAERKRSRSSSKSESPNVRLVLSALTNQQRSPTSGGRLTQPLIDIYKRYVSENTTPHSHSHPHKHK